MDKREENYYPQITVEPNSNPNRWYAVPVLGFLVKYIMMFPLSIVFEVLIIISFFASVIINPFYVLAKGKYWPLAFKYNNFFLQYMVKMQLFFFGVVDKYPSLNWEFTEKYMEDIPYPTKNNVLFAIPVVGGLVRCILIIPFMLFYTALYYGLIFLQLYNWVPVLYQGKYPESSYEYVKECVRTLSAYYAYLLGMTPHYPSFKLSIKNSFVKVFLITMGILGMILYFGFSFQAGINSARERKEEMLQKKEQEMRERITPSPTPTIEPTATTVPSPTAVPVYNTPTPVPGAYGSIEWQREVQKRWTDMGFPEPKNEEEFKFYAPQFCEKNPDLCTR